MEFLMNLESIRRKDMKDLRSYYVLSETVRDSTYFSNRS